MDNGLFPFMTSEIGIPPKQHSIYFHIQSKISLQYQHWYIKWSPQSKYHISKTRTIINAHWSHLYKNGWSEGTSQTIQSRLEHNYKSYPPLTHWQNGTTLTYSNIIYNVYHARYIRMGWSKIVNQCQATSLAKSTPTARDLCKLIQGKLKVILVWRFDYYVRYLVSQGSSTMKSPLSKLVIIHNINVSCASLVLLVTKSKHTFRSVIDLKIPFSNWKTKNNLTTCT